MTYSSNTLLILCLFIGLPGLSLKAQDSYRLTADQELAALGSSTMHNWEMVTYEAAGSGLFWLKSDKIERVENLTVSLEASSLESGKGRIMDRNARRALKVEEHPQITFKLDSIAEDETGQSQAHGLLTAAGFTRAITFRIDYNIENDVIELRARTSLKMTDFEIEPPVALAGTLRTGDAVSLDLVLSFKASTEKLD